MEDILTQRFSYATITPFKDYCKISDKKSTNTTFNNSIDELDDDERELFATERITFSFSDNFFNKDKVGRVVSLPEKRGKRKTHFFYSDGNSNVEERLEMNYARVNGKLSPSFYTTKDRHIKKHYGNPFSEISVHTIERSVRRHGDKITIKLYRHTRSRKLNSIYFKKSSTVSSVTFNMVTGNFTTLSMDRTSRKVTKTFRTNNFFFLDQVMGLKGIYDIKDYVNKTNPLYDEYKGLFDNDHFSLVLNDVFDLKQSAPFNSVWFLELMVKRFVESKKIKVSNNYEIWIKNFYPTEKFLKKNDRKLIASILDKHKIKSKITIKLMHDSPKFDIHSVRVLCFLFGENYSKYVGNIDPSHFRNSVIDSTVSPAFRYMDETTYDINNNEKENIVRIINSFNTGYNSVINNPEKSLINQSFMMEMVDHFNMLDKLRKYLPDIRMKSRTKDEFNLEHRELSKMVSFIKKGWVIEYQFADDMIDDVQKPIDLKIDLDNGSVGEITFYPYILKREEDYEEEGKFMHHCVASYSDKDRSIIVSIRTEDKSDRITCEFDCQSGTLIQAKHFCNKQPPGDMELALEKLKPKMLRYSRLGILHCIEKKKVPIKINGIEIEMEKKEPRRPGELIYNEGVPELFF